jgi:hypothetical protein
MSEAKKQGSNEVTKRRRCGERGAEKKPGMAEAMAANEESWP